MAQTRFSNRNGKAIGVAVLALAGLVSLGARGRSGALTDPPPTFAKDVAPILEQKCQVCHRPGSIAPMSLLTYDDAKQSADEIKDRVTAREMPPWHIDKTVGIQAFKNDRSLTDDQINTIVRWVDAGTPMGDPKELPPPVQWPDDAAWGLADKFGPPDLVLASTPYTVAAYGEDKWWRPTTETGMTEARWVKAIEIRPSLQGRRVVHHVLTTLQQNEPGGLTGLASTAAASGRVSAGLFMEWSVGKTGEIYNDDAGKLMMPGAKITWEVHYHSVGEEVQNDSAQLGIWFYPKGYVPKHRTILNLFSASPGEELDIPPNQITVSQDFHVLPAPARIENFQPHMHMRGKAMSMEAIYPDGRRELLSMVNNFQWNWHVNYTYADSSAPLLPKGTVLMFTAWHDNTAANTNNPDPNQWVGYGDRTVDEMAHAWVDVTYLEQADYDSLVAARKAKQRKPGAPPPPEPPPVPVSHDHGP